MTVKDCQRTLNASDHAPPLAAACTALLCGVFPLRSTPISRRCLFQVFSKDLTLSTGAMPKRFRARMVARTETPPAPWTMGSLQHGHSVEVVTGWRFRDLRIPFSMASS